MVHSVKVSNQGAVKFFKCPTYHSALETKVLPLYKAYGTLSTVGVRNSNGIGHFKASLVNECRTLLGSI